MISTKEQERAVLDTIVEALSTLEADSYVGNAFRGCCLLAESNINNDFCDNYPDMLREEQIRANKRIEDARIEAEKKQLSKEIVAKILEIVDCYKFHVIRSLSEVGEIIVLNCENTDGAKFQNAVEKRAEYNRTLSDIDEILQAVSQL